MRSIKSVLLALLMLAAVVLVAPTRAQAVTVNSAAFTGGADTVDVGGVLYAKQGATVTLTVTTTNDTECVEVSGAFSARQTSKDNPRTSWTFTTTAGAGNGAQAVTVAASKNVGNSGQGGGNADGCTGQSNSSQASYVLDNMGPVVTGSLSPAANAEGWNRNDTTLSWSATDAGSGVATGPTPASSSEISNGIFTRTSTATDRLGNSGTGTATVRVDKSAPTITATQSSAGYGQPTTVTFTCKDQAGLSGVVSCVVDGTNSNAVTVSQNGTVNGTATDRAGNTAKLAVEVKNVDTTAPVLSGTPATSPNSAGWYRNDVTVHWTASDPESGIPTPPADTTITGEGTGLTSSKTVTNGAGLSTTATSSPAVKIDRTAPATALSGAPAGWTNGSVTLSLNPTDNLSGVDRTVYSVDGGAEQTGTSVVLTSEGEHSVDYYSVDQAGNVEATQRATIHIDKTAPAISHRFTPTGYNDGAWTNQPVTVTFDCTDAGGSQVASCTEPVTKSAEGQHSVVGTVADGAGNSATDTASVLMDLTGPEGSATVVGAKSEAGWYAADARVVFACSDPQLADGSDGSGVASCPDPKDLQEGATSGASGVASDVAGNRTTLGVDGIKVDETAPELTASYSKAWSTGDVTVDWTCSDELSGIVGPDHTTTTVTGEGGNLTSTQTCSDQAGNTVTNTVDGIRIDRHAPTTLGSVPESPESGWHTGGVEVTLDASDNLSGVAGTWYSVDGGDAQTYAGPFTVTGDGAHSVTFHSIDEAGNVEGAPAPLTFLIDGTAPTTTVTNPIVPHSGWFVDSGIPFAFTAEDDHSGVAATYYQIDGGVPQTYGETFTENLSDGQHTITYWSVDVAGNAEEKRDFALQLDTVAPMITGSQSPAANKHGWNNTDVDVTFTCQDLGSGLRTGVAGCAGDTTLANEGADQTVKGDAVDVAGNRASTTYGPVNIDKTDPTLTGLPSAANGADWYRGNVTVIWVGDDGLAGIDPATQPAPSVVTGEGRNLGASATIQDKAGNTGSGSVSRLKIDRGAPTVSGTPTTSPNAAGWYSGEVVVDWTCADPKLLDGSDGSGPASCPTSNVVRGDGAGQSTTSGAPVDLAGNIGTPSTVTGINIDGTAPSTAADNQCSKVNGWCTGATADVVLTATDALSGVREIRYRIDGGDLQVATGATKTVSVPLDGSGAGTLVYWAIDKAGNAEPANEVSLKWDNIAPTVTHTVSPAPNAEGWNRANPTVTFSAKDDDKGSGVDPSSITAPVTVSAETTGHEVVGTAADLAGNTGSDKATIKLDKTEPTIEASASGVQGNNGWYVGPVTVSFTCTDSLSGIPDKACPDPVVLTTNGTNEVIRGVSDRAGNTASATLTGILIDQEKPTLAAADVNVANGSYTLGAVPKATCTARDDVSKLTDEGCTVTVTGGSSNGVGTFTWTATAKDKAGNTTTLMGTYRVTYKWGGFLQPINDTAHTLDATTSIFKAGSTVPVKLRLRDSGEAIVAATSAPSFLSPVQGSKQAAQVNEADSLLTADTGPAFKYDATAQQWIYNWQTPRSGAGSYWRIGVKLDDGQTYYVNIGLR